MARSKIWKYYDKLDLQKAQCLLCEKIIKTCGNTSNLMKHMKTHPQIDVNDHGSIIVRGMLKREPICPVKSRGRKLIKYASVKMKYETTKLKSEPIENEEHADLIADMDGNIIELVDAEAQAAVESVVNEETYANWAAPEAETDSAADTVSAVDIIEFEPKVATDLIDQDSSALDLMQDDDPLGNSQSAINSCQRLHNSAYQDCLAYFLCRDKQSLHIIKGDGFRRLTQMLCPGFQMPSIEELGARITHKTKVLTGQLRQHFANIETLSLSCAINKTSSGGAEKQLPSYLEVTAHYYEGQHRRARCLSVQSLPVQYNASNIVERLERICQRFDINKSKVTCIVTRSNRLLENAVVALLGNQRHMPCFAHLLNTLLESAVQRHEFTALCEKVRRSVAYQLSCCSGSSVTMSSSTQLLLDVNGRAISSYEMLECYVRNEPQLHKLMQLESPLDVPPALNDSELELTSELLNVLAPLVSAVRQLCGNSVSFYPSASNALPIAYTLLHELKQNEHDEQPQQHISYDMRLFLIRQLEECFESIERNVPMALSSMLDPRFRNTPFQSSSLVAKYMSHLHDLFEEKGGAAANALAEESTKDSYDIWAAYSAFSHKKHKPVININGETENQDEISCYFSTTISGLRTEPMLLWKDLSQFHPFLYSLANKYLHIPAAAIPPARLFTSAGEAVLGQHAKLLADQMSNMLFVSDCTQEEWQL